MFQLPYFLEDLYLLIITSKNVVQGVPRDHVFPVMKKTLVIPVNG